MGKLKEYYYAKQWRTDLHYLAHADVAASNSVDPTYQVGAVLVTASGVMAEGWNGTPYGFKTNETRDESGETHVYVVHAEQNAIAKAAKEGLSADGATLYINLGPCPDCAKLIKQCGIKRVVYSKPYRMASGPAVLEDMGVEVEYIKRD